MTFTGRMLLPLLLVASSSAAQDFGPDTCAQGFVWREAFPGDHVCVDPAVRTQAAADNRAAASRRQPGGGPYGPDTCRAGFVWRETRPEDRVCVTPATRTQAANDNRAAAGRYARSPARGGAGRGALVARGAAGLDRAIVLQPGRGLPGMQPPPPRPASGSASTRGFDDNGQPYIEDAMPDGSKRRQQANGVTVIRPDGTSQFYPNMVVRSNAPPPTPPDLPQDPSRGLNWMKFHNQQLLELITILVNNDQGQLNTFHRAEDMTVGADVFRQIGYRMQVLDVLAKP